MSISCENEKTQSVRQVSLMTNWEVAKYITWNNLLNKSLSDIKYSLRNYPDSLSHLVDCARWSKFNDSDIVVSCRVSFYLDVLSELNHCDCIDHMLLMLYDYGISCEDIIKLYDISLTGNLTLNCKLLELLEGAKYLLDRNSFNCIDDMYCEFLKYFGIEIKLPVLKDCVYKHNYSAFTTCDGSLTEKSKLRKELIMDICSVYDTLPVEFNTGDVSYVKQEMFANYDDYIRRTVMDYNYDMTISNCVARIYDNYKLCLTRTIIQFLKVSKETLLSYSEGSLNVFRPCSFNTVYDLCINIFDKKSIHDGMINSILNISNSDSIDVIYECIDYDDRIGFYNFDKMINNVKDFKLKYLRWCIGFISLQNKSVLSDTEIDRMLGLEIKLNNNYKCECSCRYITTSDYSELNSLHNKFKLRRNYLVNEFITAYVNVYLDLPVSWTIVNDKLFSEILFDLIF